MIRDEAKLLQQGNRAPGGFEGEAMSDFCIDNQCPSTLGSFLGTVAKSVRKGRHSLGKKKKRLRAHNSKACVQNRWSRGTPRNRVFGMARSLSSFLEF
ncbi:hypothetical protein PoB_003969700 [Plakobranchus ocellatus]|uniref:Uncharacterized protein n=1 Tax=Plakobranchus ocellatus TaxID=259542 RepID=A0AAV4B0Z0_9GAST|nr:hypothetical protein PoB_003969700 [Plakobranchus ocellatus]